MKLLLSLFAPCALVAWLFAPPAVAADPIPEYDLLITNGRVVDGTGNPWFHGDVAITGDKIVAVGRVPEGKAKRTIRKGGRTAAGQRPDIKKAYVTLKAGEKLPFFDEPEADKKADKKAAKKETK